MAFTTTGSVRANAEADSIVRRLLLGRETTYDLRAEYGCHVATINRIYRARTTPAQRLAAKSRKLSRARKATLAKLGTSFWGAGANRRPVGAVRIAKNDSGKPYAIVKVREGLWVARARVVWSQANGRPVPRGHVVIHENDDTLDDSPGNPRLHDYHRAAEAPRGGQ